MSNIFSLEDYTLVWLAPLPFEASAALLMLDEHHMAPNITLGQTIRYHFGRIGYQNVAIACFPAGEIGIGSAGVMAAEVLRDLPNLQYGLLVGIGAGIPSTENDIRLGDVAVSVPADDNLGIIGYDLVKVEPEELRLKQWQNASHPAIRSAISHIAAKSLSLLSSEPRGINNAPWLSHLRRFKGTRFELPRTPPLTRFSNQQRQPANAPHIHYGCILSGNRVIKSAYYRDALVKSHNAIAIEMEAAGMMNKLPVGIIRGISDFADAEKTDEWQMYAAASAAAYAKELVICLGPVQTVNVSNLRLIPTIRISQVHLYQILDERAKNMAPNSDWKNSVVDLLKLLSLDWTIPARARLAKRWNVLVGENGSAVRNIALYWAIMDELAKNQGNVSPSFARALLE